MPTLSVILITRNEEANLADCLASLEGIAQQIVVVDTNSSDRTWKSLNPMGRRLLSRQIGLDLAPKRTGAWILLPVNGFYP